MKRRAFLLSAATAFVPIPAVPAPMRIVLSQNVTLMFEGHYISDNWSPFRNPILWPEGVRWEGAP